MKKKKIELPFLVGPLNLEVPSYWAVPLGPNWDQTVEDPENEGQRVLEGNWDVEGLRKDIHYWDLETLDLSDQNLFL